MGGDGEWSLTDRSSLKVIDGALFFPFGWQNGRGPSRCLFLFLFCGADRLWDNEPTAVQNLPSAE
jgi:hypothetical protein